MISRAERLAEIADRAGKATPEPWIADEFCMHRAEKVRVGTNDGSPLYYHNSANICECSVNFRGKSVLDGNKREPKIGVVTAERNAAFIAHARSDIPWLLDYVKDLRSALEEAKEALRPFAAFGAELHPARQDSESVYHRFTFGDLRRAAEVAAKLEKL